MRLAVLIISLCLVALVGLQSCSVMVGGSLSNNEDLSGSGALGVFVSFLFLLGGAFVMGFPKVSMIIFTIAAFFGFIGASASDFSDLYIWSSVSIILAILSFFGSNEKRKKNPKSPVAHER